MNTTVAPTVRIRAWYTGDGACWCGRPAIVARDGQMGVVDGETLWHGYCDPHWTLWLTRAREQGWIVTIGVLDVSTGETPRRAVSG